MLPILGVHINFEWSSLWPLVILIAIGVSIPVLLSILKLKFIPVFVVEILVGLIIAHIPFMRDIFVISHDGAYEFNSLASGLYSIGMAMLLFLSGLDTDTRAIKTDIKNNHKTLNTFKLSWIFIGSVILLSFIGSLLFIPYYKNVLFGIVLITIVFSSTFASLTIPLIHVENLQSTTIGKLICTYSTISEMMSIVSISILLIIQSDYKNLWQILILLAILGLTYILRKIGKLEVFKDKMEGIVFLGIRLIILLLLTSIIITAQSGAEFILGAFLSGMIIKTTKIKHKTIEIFEAVGFGIFIPIFYLLVGINVGVTIDFTNPIVLLLIGILFVMFIATKLPFLSLLKWFPAKTVIPTMFIVSSTIIVALTCEHFGVIESELMDSLIIASSLTCIIPPILFDIFEIDKKYGTSRLKYDSIIIDPYDIKK